MEYDTSAEKDEFNGIPMHEFAIQAEEAIGANLRSGSQEEVRRRDYFIENKLHTQSLESSTQSSVFEAIESDLQRQLCHAQLECMNYIEKYNEYRSESAPERHRLQDQESFLAYEARKR